MTLLSISKNALFLYLSRLEDQKYVLEEKLKISEDEKLSSDKIASDLHIKNKELEVMNENLDKEIEKIKKEASLNLQEINEFVYREKLKSEEIVSDLHRKNKELEFKKENLEKEIEKIKKDSKLEIENLVNNLNEQIDNKEKMTVFLKEITEKASKIEEINSNLKKEKIRLENSSLNVNKGIISKIKSLF